jgi:hypothetical protein
MFRDKFHHCLFAHISQRITVSAAGGKTEDFMSAAKLFYRAKRQVKVPTYLVPATQKVGNKSFLRLALHVLWCGTQHICVTTCCLAAAAATGTWTTFCCWSFLHLLLLLCCFGPGLDNACGAAHVQVWADV